MTRGGLVRGGLVRGGLGLGGLWQGGLVMENPPIVAPHPPQWPGVSPACHLTIGHSGTSPSGWNSGYHTLLSKMALAGSNICVCQKYRKPFLTEITHRKILRKRFFHENWYFWHFWAKNWKNGPCAKVTFFRFCPFFLIESKSIENTKKIVSPND